MELVEIDPELASRYVADQIADPRGFHSEISVEDEMFLHALTGYRGNANRAFVVYLLQGKQMLDQLQQLAEWAFGGWDGVRTFLDFASGYGRFTRHLIQTIPAERVVVCDIYEDAVRFQQKHFGVDGVASVPNPEDLDLDRGGFDFIFVSSLFSHLPQRNFLDWLQKLSSLLSERGLLVFSTRKTESAESDFEFSPLSESRSLAATEYGTTFVSEGFVRKCLSEVMNGELRWRRFEHGHLNFQDLYVVSRDRDADFATLDYQRGHSGHVGACWKNPSGSIHMRGWAADFDSVERPIQIEVYANGNLVGACSPDHDRPDVAKLFASPIALWSGWNCAFEDGLLDLDDWITIQVVNNRDQRHVISVEKLSAMLRW